LSLLTNDKIDIKINVVYELIATQESKNSEPYMNTEQVKFWLSTYLIVACNILPILANDFPSSNKVAYYKLFNNWNDVLPTVTNDITYKFMNTTKKMTYRDFTYACSEHQDLFNIVKLRQLVNSYMSINN
jgi:hypothetical protein